MNDCQGRGRMTRQGEHVATVEYAVQSEPDAVSNAIHGDVEIVEGEKSLSLNDQFTLHMEGSLSSTSWWNRSPISPEASTISEASVLFASPPDASGVALAEKGPLGRESL